MATVLSRALKLPGKKPPPRDHPAPAGPGEMGRRDSGGEADRGLAPTRAQLPARGGERCSPRGLGSTRHQGANEAFGGLGVVGAGQAWETQREGRGRRVWMVARRCGGGECQGARRHCPQGRAVRLASFPELREGGTAGSPTPSVLGWTWAGSGSGRMASDPLEQPLHLMTTLMLP